MKKQGLLRKFGLTAIVVLLCLAMMITCFTFVIPPMSLPLAEVASIGNAVSKVDVLDEVNIQKTVNYGDTIDIDTVAGSTVTVTAPNGDEITDVSNGVVANQVGNYKVTYTNDGVSYDFYVRVTLDEDYFLYVDYNGADIPTYAKVGKSIVLPEASVMFYDEDNILRDYNDVGGAYTVSVTTSRDSKEYNVKDVDDVAEADRTIDVGNTVGKLFITYTARLEDGAKYYSQTFTVNVQSNVPETGNPTLSVSGVQKDVSVNRAVTLPTATATDSYDDNVKIEIKVTFDGEDVKTVDIDENGYAYQDPNKTYSAVKFDNNKSMTFYPLEKGSYKVTYTAYNDFYVEGGSVGKSSTREYYITVSDLAAPVFKSVDEDLIPETWGMVVYKAGEDGEKEDTGLGGKITFTVPEVVDNLDHMYPDPALENDTNLLSVYFRIMDADNSKTIIEFTNILADDKDEDETVAEQSKYTSKDGSAYTVDAVFNKDNDFVFDFNNYNKVDSEGNVVSKAGTYTVLYRARDKANNTSSKTYTITLQDTYEDLAAPTTAEVTVPDYISAEDETLTIPYAVYADASDTRPTVDYRVYTDATLGTGDVRYIEVNGGEIAEFEGGYLVINKGKSNEKKLLLGDKLYFYVGVTDKVGNFKSNVENNVDLTAEEVEEDAYKATEATIKVISTEPAGFEYDDNSGMQFAVVDAKNGATSITQGDTVVASGFSIQTASLDMRAYTGFEVIVYDPLGNPVNVTLETVSVPNEAGDYATIYVQNIQFNASMAASSDDEEYYVMTVRVFDVNGNNAVYGYKLTDIAKAPNGYVKPAAIGTIGNSGDINVTYKLPNSDITIRGDENSTYYFVRKISGKAFSIMGNEFTAKRQDNYSVTDGYIDSDVLDSGADFGYFDYSEVKQTGINKATHNFYINDTYAPIIEVQGVMPTYQDWDDVEDAEEGAAVTKKATVVLPTVIAYTESGTAVVDIAVKDPDSYDVKFDKDTNSFEATKDGAYKVTVTATYANATPVKSEYTIKIGDIVGPEFTVDKTTYATMKVGDTFTFAKMNVSETTGVTVTKKLIDPSHEEVTDATVSGSVSTYAEKANNGTSITLSMAGTYEIVYTATDSVGNETTQRYTVTVVSSGSSTPTTWTTLSTVLIVVAVVLLAGVIVYVVRFRKVKK